jgi:hypothetical protein
MENRKKDIDKIEKFNYEELHKWIESRLKGIDEHFTIQKREKKRKFELIVKAYHQINDENFRTCKFHPIMNTLMDEMTYISVSKKRIEENKEYIFEVVNLFKKIPDFRDKSFLYDFAREGNFKGIEAYDMDLHHLILKALACHKAVGDYDFWIEQSDDKRYVRTSFNAMVKRGYRLDLIMRIEPFGIYLSSFIDDNVDDLKSTFVKMVQRHGIKSFLIQFVSIFDLFNVDQIKVIMRAIGFADRITFSYPVVNSGK